MSFLSFLDSDVLKTVPVSNVSVAVKDLSGFGRSCALVLDTTAASNSIFLHPMVDEEGTTVEFAGLFGLIQYQKKNNSWVTVKHYVSGR